MAVAPPRFTSPRPALPGTLWSGLMRASRRRGSSLEEAPLGAATPLRAPAAADDLSGPRPGLLCARRNRRRRMVSPAHPLAACAFPCSAPRLPRKLQNLAEKIRQKLSLASPNPSGVRAGERQFPPSPPARRSVGRAASEEFFRKNSCARGLAPLRASRNEPHNPCLPPRRARIRSPRLSLAPRSGTVRHCLPTGRPA